ncbi:uncharacterized protein LOC121872174, partial [Homarus americanus]|uniref:uncharacterized protein LOC121872174 n=1 Tax=Homarus americanus TaxID=6706 RepID=UPI001C489E3B
MVLLWSCCVRVPYNPSKDQAFQVASWTPHRGLVLITHLPLFPEKFSKFPHRPSLLAASEVNPFNRIITVQDPGVPGGQKFEFKGPVPNLMDYLAKALNFT